ncbi:MAG: FHA domain-containing protein [Alphaproteobacteria bacterium]|nr:FHA domain-containing protein [Alphaproteobacteria bacterium]
MNAGTVLDGRFGLVAQASADGAFTYWTARDATGDGDAVVAVAHPHLAGEAERLLAAARAWAGLPPHPAVVRCLGSGQLDDGRCWLAWEDVGERTLAEAVSDGSPDALLLAVLDVGEALTHAHGMACVHGGLNPDLVTLRADGSAALAGFGIGHLTAAGPAVVYAAPETMQADAPATPAADVYGFAMLVMLALGAAPLPYWVLRDANRHLASLGLEPGLEGVLARALDWDPAARTAPPRSIRDALLADPDRVVRLARTAMEAGREDRAEALLADLPDALRGRAEVEDLRVQIARSRAARGDPDEAIAALTELAATVPGAVLWLEIADLQRRTGRDGAVASLERALEAHRTREEAVAALEQLVELDPDRFLRWGRALVQFEPDDVGALELRIGRALHAEGNGTTALHWLDRAAASGCDTPELHALREELRAARGEWSAVIDVLRTRAASTGSVEPLEKAAGLATRAGSGEAVDLYRQILEIDPAHADAHRQLARHAIRSDDPRTARAHLAALCATPVADAGDHTALARLLLRDGALDDALRSAKHALGLEPGHVVALSAARRAAQELGQLGDAIRWEQQLVALQSSTGGRADAARRVHLGHLHRMAGAADAAHAAYETALAVEPDHLEAWWGLYACARERQLAGEALGEPLRFGPHEALARLLAEILDADAALAFLEADPLGRVLAARGTEPAAALAIAVVDLLLYRHAIGPRFFDVLMDACPERLARIAAVRNLWSGGAAHTGSFPIATAARWSDDGPDFAADLQRDLVFFRTWPGEADWYDDDALTALLSRPDPLPAGEGDDEADDDEDLLLDDQEIAVLQIGAGLRLTNHEIEESTALGPDEAPALPGVLRVHRHGDRVYLAVSAGELSRDGQRAGEMRMLGGDRVEWDGVPIRYLKVPGLHALQAPEPPEVTSPSFEPDDSLPGEIAPVPAVELDPTEAALVWEDGPEVWAIRLDPPEVCVLEMPDGTVRFTTEPDEGAIAVVLNRHGAHFIEQELTNATGFMGTLSARQIHPDELLMLGGRVFRFRASTAGGGEVLAMPPPSLATTRPTLLLDDGSPGGQPIPISAERFRIGRARTCELQIRTDGLLSRVHCIVRLEGSRASVKDAGSSNGTRVNGRPAEDWIELTAGDVIELGNTRLAYTLRSPQPEDPSDGPDPLEEADTIQLADDLVAEASTMLDAEMAELAGATRPWGAAECVEKVRVANQAFHILFEHVDRHAGAGRGRAALQLLLDSRRPEYGGLFDGLELEEASLPSGWVLDAIEARPEAERRTVLNRALLDLVDSATDRACTLLPEDEVDAVLARMAALGYRNHLRR